MKTKKIEVEVYFSDDGKYCNKVCLFLTDAKEIFRETNCFYFGNGLLYNGNNKEYLRCTDCIEEFGNE